MELIRRFDQEHLLVRVADDVQFVIPQWMFDAAACNLKHDAEHPVISVEALRSLRSLLDVQSSLHQAATFTSALLAEQGASHGQEAGRDPGPSTQVRLRRR